MKKVVVYLSFLSMFYLECGAQISDFKMVNVKNFGNTPIPKTLDTLGQNEFKNARFEEWKQYLDSIEVKNSNQISLARLIESRFDTTLTLFLPTKAIFDILDLLKTVRFAEEEKFDETIWTPTILLGRKKFKYHSIQMQQALTKPSDQESFAKAIGSGYIEVTKNLIPDAVISDTATSFFWYMKKFPVVKLTFTFYIKEYPDKFYTYNVFFIYKDTFNYFVRFEFMHEQKKEWESFEKLFFDRLQLL